ncbi:MAG: hypothetical protein KDK10_02765 [Maritimibacter sp.]|nr:hypothetical protein [Maritimibacter sp.]
MGISQIVRPDMWRAFFADLHARGIAGVVQRRFLIELWPALLIVTLHPVRTRPGIVLTLFGRLLAAKVALSLLRPKLALRSMSLTGKGASGFLPAGLVQIALGAFPGWLATAG